MTRAVTEEWHQPICSECGRPIERIEDAVCFWREDCYGCSDPAVVHAEHGWPGDVMAVRVETMRLAPMDAVTVAMCTAHDDHATRLLWRSWVSVVLGLPLSRVSLVGELVVHRSAADRVMTIAEARARLERGS